ncbi:MAG: hypothetical protein ABI193_02600 [Minicystis sp.]
MAHQGLTLALAALLLAGCPAPVDLTPPRPLPSATAPVAAALPAFNAGKWGDFVSPRFGLQLILPDGRAWSIDDHGSAWLVARHAPTGSELALRTWREDGSAHRVRCEEEARLWRKLPEKEGADLVEQRAVNVPPDFDTRVEVGVVTPLPGARGAKATSTGIRGFVLAFGGKAHRCFAYVFSTRAEGPGAEQAVGERLATMVQGSLEKIRLRNDLDPTLPLEPLPAELPGVPPPR